MVRGVVGLEYPPSRFPPDRRPPAKRPRSPEPPPHAPGERKSRRLAGEDPLPNAQYDIILAAQNGILRSVKGLGLKGREPERSALDRSRDLAGDLNEEVPTDPRLARRGENTVHFDLDPNNSKRVQLFEPVLTIY